MQLFVRFCFAAADFEVMSSLQKTIIWYFRALEAKIQQKNEVVAALLHGQVQLKREFGDSKWMLGNPLKSAPNSSSETSKSSFASQE